MPTIRIFQIFWKTVCTKPAGNLRNVTSQPPLGVCRLVGETIKRAATLICRFFIERTIVDLKLALDQLMVLDYSNR